ncbi:inositol monophosphatase family protein [Falsirhodobacter deserti]|uniref:inositol monophosphatase family protein n=1 Tax=Falsirhodobacter deserti TaxID=1365611 RepID=UPI000FE37B24|nr:inositol monophosphatase family protein [Falsirhodobacter deserti]
MTTPPDMDSRAAFLRTLMTEAAEIAREGFAKAASFTMKGPQDFLTETDLAVEAHIRARLAETFPDDGILGEEGGGSLAPVLWVIDPIDGTANFARRVPHFCVCIAVVVEGVTELGAIIQPISNERWFARRGGGATKNGAPMRAAATATLDTASVEFGWSRRTSVEQYLQVQRNLLTGGASIRRGGSGALALAWVAEGRSDGYLEIEMNCWDCLAGLLMVREAGGQTALWPEILTDVARPGPVFAAAAGIAAPLLAAFTEGTRHG